MELTTLDEYYSFIDKLSPVDTDPIDLRKILKGVEKNLEESNRNEVLWELYILLFQILKGKVEPCSFTSNKDGTKNGHPSYSYFSDEAYEYLLTRANSTQNIFMKARYWHILWDSPKKHNNYAKNAIDNYFSIISSAEDSEDGHWLCIKSIKNALPVSAQVKYRTDELYDLSDTILSENSHFPDFLKKHLINYLVEVPKPRREKFKSYQETLLLLGKKYKGEKKESTVLEDLMKAGLKIAEKTNVDVKKWNERVGDAVMAQENKRKNDENGLAKTSIYTRALKYYHLSGNEKKITKVIGLYNEHKKNVKLGEFPLSLVDIDKIGIVQEYMDLVVDSLLKSGATDTFLYLAQTTTITPKVDKKTEHDWSIFDYASVLSFDINVNVSGKEKRDNKKERAFMDYYVTLDNFVGPFLDKLFIQGIKEEIITAESLVKHLQNNSWLGHTLSKDTSSGKRYEYNWISVIAPSIFDFFKQTESALYSHKPYANYILCIDSLTLKFEGVIRDFALLAKINPNVTVKGGGLRQKYIEDFIKDKEFRKYFSESDLLFFEFLFISKDGLNLRNNIAHSFFVANHYLYHYMYLLICAFLKIGKYVLNTEPKNK